MSAFELLCYVATLNLCISFLTFIVCTILTLRERSKFVKVVNKRKSIKL